ncbi:unnamed protein product [Schistosoma mattheei]|uniref:Peptidase A2 domain-containing protein n=1 Tax=Schistosoma mattheei TaxID=31246 RepID=A0AA85AVJ1_9TREM|nr:unnamed protein product [Schistosoma mattheei]
MTAEEATESSCLDSYQRATAVTDFSSRGTSRGQSSSRCSRWSSWNNYHGHQAQCIYCKRFGRNAERCGHNRSHNPGKPRLYYLSSSHVDHVCPITVRGRVQGVEIEILLDTGASVSLIKEELLRKLNYKTQQNRCLSRLITACGDPLKLCSKVWLDLTIEKHQFRHEFLVSSALTWDMILGVDFMLKHQVSIFMDRS